MATSTFSLWLVPPLERTDGDGASRSIAAERLSFIIKSLAKANSAPVFAPHVTLFSSIELTPKEIEAKVVEAVEAWRRGGDGDGRMQLRFSDVRAGPSYFQCVLAAIEPNQRLQALHEAVKTRLPRSSKPPPNPTYFPHLSLLYHDALSNSDKERIIAELGAAGEIAPALDPATAGRSFVRVGGVEGFAPAEILVVTNGEVEQWEVVGRVPI